MRRLILAVVMGIALMALVGCSLLPGGVADLKAGDCFDKPATDGEISEVQHRPCTDAHDSEVFLVVQHPAPSSEPYPVVSGFDDFIQETCIPTFESYTGRVWATDTELEIGYFHPTLTGWAGGDRGFTCHLYRVDGAKLTASMAATTPGASPANT